MKVCGRRHIPTSVFISFLLVTTLRAQSEDWSRPSNIQDIEQENLFSAELWIDLGVQASIDIWADSQLTHSTKYREAFRSGTGYGALFGTSSFRSISPGVFESVLIAPHYGYMHRTYSGQDAQDEISGTIRCSTLRTDSMVFGARIGIGSYQPSDCVYGHLYATGEIGGVRYSETTIQRSLPTPSEDVLIRNSWSFAGGGGLGAEVVLDGFGLNVEAGFHSFGRPKYGAGAVDSTNDYLNTMYFSLTLFFRF